MEKRFIVSRPTDVTLLSEKELHDLLSLTISNMIIIDRDNLKNVSFSMCADVVTKCIHNSIAFILGMKALKHYFVTKDFQSVDTLLVDIIKTSRAVDTIK